MRGCSFELYSITNKREILALVADGAVFRFEVFHRDLEHVVAADADTMNFHERLFAWLGFRGMAGGMSLVRFSHGQILTRTGDARTIKPPDPSGGNLERGKRFPQQEPGDRAPLHDFGRTRARPAEPEAPESSPCARQSKLSERRK